MEEEIGLVVDSFGSDRKRRFNQFDLNLLRALDVLLEEQNITHAAARMNVTQPAMSGALQRMRDYFGDQLLIRVGREMKLTPLAQSLAGPVRALLTDIRQTLGVDPQFDPKTTRRDFTIAMSDYAAFMIMPKLLERLASTAPYISCNIVPLDEAVFARLASNEIEFSIASDHWRGYGTYESPGRDIRSNLLFTERFVCVVDAANPITGPALSLEDYLNMQHLVVRMEGRMLSIVEHTWRVEDLSPRVVASATSFTSVIGMLRGTPYVATVQARLSRALAASLAVREMTCPIEIPQLREALLWHSRNDFEPGHRFMRDLIIEAARGIDVESSPAS
jgi:LysR family transcriptional regulator, nod-box dependent transcriptional activator